MQTFMPYPDFVASSVVLDTQRLGKQRVENFQILRALVWPTYGWKNHPATRMWRGFVPALVCYGLATCDEWEARGYVDVTRSALLEFTGGEVPDFDELAEDGRLPPWFGLDAFHRSHQSSLVRKVPEHYRPYFPDIPDDLTYVWPPASFPRWPLARPVVDGVPQPLDLAEALDLLGLEQERPDQAEAVAAVSAARSHRAAAPRGGGLTTTGLLAALCTPGMTVWVTPGEPPAPVPMPDRVERRASTVGAAAASIARAPDDAAALAMKEIALSESEFRFLKTGQLTQAAVAGAGLVVADGVEGLPDLGLPVLTLVTTT